MHRESDLRVEREREEAQYNTNAIFKSQAIIELIYSEGREW